ncbi:MAG: PEP/pyruvate-binding domain-containing protein [Candidatus Micrarchaeia archaeon]
MIIQPRFQDYPNKIVHEIGKTVRVPDFKNYFGGKSGGKAGGLEFFRYALLENEARLKDEFSGRVFFACPKTSVLQTELFVEFMEKNKLWAAVASGMPDEMLVQTFLKAQFTPAQRAVFNTIINDCEEGHVRPIVVRSSSLNEDAERAAFAGIYKSVMLPNCHPDPEVRLAQFEAAVKLVYASMFSNAAHEYRRDKKIPEGGEQMAVLVQNMAGRLWRTMDGGQIYHPEVAFAAFSFNDFPLGDVKAEDGVARIALGLGPGVVDGDNKMAIRVNLGKPDPPAGMLDWRQTLRIAPEMLYAMELNGSAELPTGENFYLKKIPYGKHSNQEMILQYCRWFDGFDTIWDTERGENASPVAMFHRLLRGLHGNSFVKVLRTTNDILKAYFGTNVDFEGAADFIRDQYNKYYSVIYVLQARSQIRGDMGRVKELPDVAPEKLVLRAQGAAGKGSQKFRFIAHVPPEEFNSGTSWRLGQDLGSVNKDFKGAEGDGRYLLLAPGRFGSSDLGLGIKGDFGTISNSVGIGEFMQGNWEPSQGAHMFEDMIGTGKALFSYKGEQLSMENLAKLAVSTRKAGGITIYEFAEPLELLIDDAGGLLVHSP